MSTPCRVIACSLWKGSEDEPEDLVSAIPVSVQHAMTGFFDQPLVVIQVQGPARSGKSTFMRLIGGWLARCPGLTSADCVEVWDKMVGAFSVNAIPCEGGQHWHPKEEVSETVSGTRVLNAFGVSHEGEPCTKGADGCFLAMPAGTFGRRKPFVVLLIDCEGTGDQDDEYDSKLMLPGLVFSGGGAAIVRTAQKGLVHASLDQLSHVVEAVKLYQSAFNASGGEETEADPGADPYAARGGAAEQEDPRAAGQQAPKLGAAVLLCNDYSLAMAPGQSIEGMESDVFDVEYPRSGKKLSRKQSRANEKRELLQSAFRTLHRCTTEPPGDGRYRPCNCDAMMSDLKALARRVLRPILQDETPRCVFGHSGLPLTVGTLFNLLPSVVEAASASDLRVPSMLEGAKARGIQLVASKSKAAASAALLAARSLCDVDSAWRITRDAVPLCIEAARSAIDRVVHDTLRTVPICRGSDGVEKTKREAHESLVEINAILMRHLERVAKHHEEAGAALVLQAASNLPIPGADATERSKQALYQYTDALPDVLSSMTDDELAASVEVFKGMTDYAAAALRSSTTDGEEGPLHAMYNKVHGDVARQADAAIARATSDIGHTLTRDAAQEFAATLRSGVSGESPSGDERCDGNPDYNPAAAGPSDPADVLVPHLEQLVMCHPAGPITQQGLLEVVGLVPVARSDQADESTPDGEYLIGQVRTLLEHRAMRLLQEQKSVHMRAYRLHARLADETTYRQRAKEMRKQRAAAEAKFRAEARAREASEEKARLMQEQLSKLQNAANRRAALDELHRLRGIHAAVKKPEGLVKLLFPGSDFAWLRAQGCVRAIDGGIAFVRAQPDGEVLEAKGDAEKVGGGKGKCVAVSTASRGWVYF